MTRAGRINLALGIVAFISGVIIALIFVREPMSPLTAELLRAAREKWAAAKIVDYDIRYRMHGSVYEIRVRDGLVTAATVDGQTPRTSDVGAYTAEGLFETLAQELENLADPSGPFAGRPAVVTMRVRFNEHHGCVERYLRSAGRAGRPVAIELLEFGEDGARKSDGR